jgi:hypothetical protein
MRGITQITLAVALSCAAQFSYGQMSVNKKNKSYFEVLGGFNYSFVSVKDRYSVLSAGSLTDPESLEKEYAKGFKNTGRQFGVRWSYNFTNLLSVSLGFGYETLGFNYQTSYSWADTLTSQNFDREMHHEQKASYFSFPIQARYDFTQGQFKPFAQGGLFMDFRHQASKIIHYDNTIDGEQTANQVSSSALVSITDNIRNFNMGATVGAGVNYYTKFVTIGVETNFRFGFMNIVEDDRRYADLSGFALKYLDVLDQLKLNTYNVQFSLSVPISNSVTSNILRRKSYRRRK